MLNKGEISNNTLARLISFENIIWMVMLAFSVGGVYAALASDTKATKLKVNMVVAEQKEISKDVQEIKINLAVMKANQNTIKSQLSIQQRSIDQVLNILREERYKD